MLIKNAYPNPHLYYLLYLGDFYAHLHLRTTILDLTPLKDSSIPQGHHLLYMHIVLDA